VTRVSFGIGFWHLDHSSIQTTMG